MRLGLFVAGALALSACRGERAPRFRAVGTVLCEGIHNGDTGAWRTELDYLRDPALLDEVGRKLTERGMVVPMAAARRGLSVQRRTDSRLIEVAVALDDSVKALAVCNLLMRDYVEQAQAAARSHVSILDDCALGHR